MRTIRVLKFLIITAVISLCADPISKFSGNVIEVDVDAVKIDIVQATEVPVGSKVNLYYKTSFGQKMEVGQWRVTRTDETIIYAEPVNMISKPMVGLHAEVLFSANDDRGEVIANAQLLPQSDDVQERKKGDTVDSKIYLDKAKQIADDMKKNVKNYSEQKIKKSFNEYMKNIQTAVSMNNAEAYYRLALIYEDGHGDIKRDLKKMVDNLIKAGEHGYVEAQFILGDMYEDGDEVVKDEVRAIYWYRKAEEQGDKEAKRALDKLLKKQQEEISVQRREKGLKDDSATGDCYVGCLPSSGRYKSCNIACKDNTKSGKDSLINNNMTNIVAGPASWEDCAKTMKKLGIEGW